MAKWNWTSLDFGASFSCALASGTPIREQAIINNRKSFFVISAFNSSSASRSCSVFFHTGRTQLNLWFASTAIAHSLSFPENYGTFGLWDSHNVYGRNASGKHSAAFQRYRYTAHAYLELVVTFVRALNDNTVAHIRPFAH